MVLMRNSNVAMSALRQKQELLSTKDLFVRNYFGSDSYDEAVLLEVKAVRKSYPSQAQILSYMTLLNAPSGINQRSRVKLSDGVHRMILSLEARDSRLAAPTRENADEVSHGN